MTQQALWNMIGSCKPWWKLFCLSRLRAFPLHSIIFIGLYDVRFWVEWGGEGMLCVQVCGSFSSGETTRQRVWHCEPARFCVNVFMCHILYINFHSFIHII